MSKEKNFSLMFETAKFFGRQARDFLAEKASKGAATFDRATEKMSSAVTNEVFFFQQSLRMRPHYEQNLAEGRSQRESLIAAAEQLIEMLCEDAGRDDENTPSP